MSQNKVDVDGAVPLGEEGDVAAGPAPEVDHLKLQIGHNIASQAPINTQPACT